jgi:aspartyl-tRNA(Asn)/glutamyl-tRNA(Gln) amidotransferase subunit A
VAFKLGERTADPLAMYLSDYYTVPMPLAGIPAISIPCGLSDGLPVGFQIAGPAFSEAGILDAAHALEKAIGFEGLSVSVDRPDADRRSQNEGPEAPRG